MPSSRGAGRQIVHVIVDNYATHNHPKVKTWLGRHPRFVFHFTPTSCSWLNAVEGFFAKLARRLKRGAILGHGRQSGGNQWKHGPRLGVQ
jgi:transposase